MTRPLVAASCVMTVSWTLAATTPQDRTPSAPQTTFRAAVELVSVDVNVLDRDGRPVDTLTAPDFTLTVDGRARRIVSAEFVRVSPYAAPRPAATYYSSNEQAGSGRLIALIIDQGNISAGRVRAATESAIRFVKRLSPADRVGLFAIPAPGPTINFTSNHALIQAQLPRIVGHRSSNPGPERVGLGEAARIERGDLMALNRAADRECANADRQMCVQELGLEARETIAEARNRARSSLGALRRLIEQLAETQSPKTVVYLSEALVIDQDRSELAWVGPLAAKGRIAVNVLRIDPTLSDAGAPRPSFSRSEDIALAEEGLSMLAGLARGSLFRVIGNADNIFNRLSLEMSGYYLLGFEPEAGDRDGKPHTIKIAVPGRRGVDIRAREDFAVDAPRMQATDEVLTDTLRSPLLAADIGLKVTAYTFREAAGQQLRILIAADIDRAHNPSAVVALGYALMDGSGHVVSSQFEPRLTAPVIGGTQHFVATAAGGAPGIYGLKLAVVDEAGRRGSVEHAFRAQLTSAGQVRAADLLIGESAGVAGAVPAVTGDFTDAETLHGYLEIYADSAEVLQSASVILEIAAREDSRPLESVPARFDEATSTGSRSIAEGVLPIALLPPGEYHARAVISIGGRKAGQVIRPFRVLRSTTPATGAPSRRGRARPRADATLGVRVDAFQRATVLTPEVVGFFVGRMGAGAPGAVPSDAVEHARAGRFDAAADAARSSGHALATAFLEGMSLYARGNLEAAAVKFRETLRIDSEFLAAAFYLGACYAAGGRDRDAAAAWHTSLVTEGDAPFVYTLLGDAFLRQREIDRAIGVLTEATGRWPDEPQVRMRLGMALAMAGKSSEALQVLEAHLTQNPDDTERLFLVMRVIYEAHAGGRSIGTPEEDRARFDRYAAAYASAAGPQLALVEQWKKFMSRR